MNDFKNLENDSTISGIEKRFTLRKGLTFEFYNFQENGEDMEFSQVVDVLNQLHTENKLLKKSLFESEKELLWVTSDEVDRALYFDDEVEELREEIFGLTVAELIEEWKID